MKITRDFEPADRYVYDFGPCSYKNGFAQIDTKQDAWYYGTWCSPTRRIIVNYAEGDVTITECDTDDEFVAEMRKLVEWNDTNGWGPARIDPGLDPAMKAQFERLGLAEVMH